MTIGGSLWSGLLHLIRTQNMLAPVVYSNYVNSDSHMLYVILFQYKQTLPHFNFGALNPQFIYNQKLHIEGKLMSMLKVKNVLVVW